jgi:hypothetical protein
MHPITTADLHAIVGLVLENLNMERLVREVGQAVAQWIFGGKDVVDPSLWCTLLTLFYAAMQQSAQDGRKAK